MVQSQITTDVQGKVKKTHENFHRMEDFQSIYQNITTPSP